ncbi:MAG: hydroxyacylglutathione hydrolase [Gammaproteobacteria bacterium]|tara:strand:- start:3077 stop:3841 length:765 start_codon:yes stop_codon:yes gene_type:complete
MFSVNPIKAFSDNYIWLLTTNEGSIVVDPGEAVKILDLIDKDKINLQGVLITHHHFDHTSGLGDLINKKLVDVYGPENNIIEINKRVKDLDQISVLGIDFEVIEIPGHTLDHIAFYAFNDNNPILFCGDTLFAGGCGRVFEGTYEQMFNSLKKLSSLPSNTKVYCGHEYTLSNLKFALEVDIQNKYLMDEYKHILELSKSSTPSLPTTIDKEFKVNPFLRCNDPFIKNKIKKEFGIEGNELETFTALRKWKDNF